MWWASPHRTGERSKRRPFVVVSANAFNENPRYAKIVVVDLTATARSGGPFAWEVRLPRGAGGLERASVAKCAEPYTLFKDQLDELCGTLPSRFLEQIDSALALALALR